MTKWISSIILLQNEATWHVSIVWQTGYIASDLDVIDIDIDLFMFIWSTVGTVKGHEI